jgi:hypothetical protein
MNLAVGFALAATFSVASTAFAEETTPSLEERLVVARADAAAAHGAAMISLDECSGRYRTADGLEFVIVRDGETLTMELPEVLTSRETRLHADGSGVFFVADPAVLLSFWTDTDGRVTSIAVYAEHGAPPIEAAKVPSRRGIVTIHDVSTVLVDATIAALD